MNNATTELHVFRIRTAESFWYVATSSDEALELFRKDPQWEHDEGDVAKVEQLEDGESLTILGERAGEDRTLPAREWCATTPRGYLCSTCY